MVNPLVSIPLFSDLSGKDLDALLTTLKTIEVKPLEVLVREGDSGQDFYVIKSGELEILRGAGTPDEMLLNVVGDGQYFGEMSLIMPGGLRTATVRARTRSTLLVISRPEFDDLLLRFPLLAYSMVRVLSERLDATNTSTFHDLTEKNRQLQKAYDELKAAQDQLIEKERMERELQVAAEIQMSILPEVMPFVSGYDFGGCVEPARQVGGDFFDVFPVGENKVAILIGDVADKGVPSAIFMARVHALIMAEADSLPTAEGVLRKVNDHITRLQKSTQFVTALYGILDCETGKFDYARAGHEPGLMISVKGFQRLPHNTGMALGICDTMKLDIGSVYLEKGSSLLFYTDGLTDCRNPEGEAYGLERIKEELLSLQGLPAQQVCDCLLKALKKFQKGARQDDDVTLVAIHAAN